ncbi:MAG TPA: type II toxin-antitoxin system RelE/ParE family toxin [Blastocatellia bacterium]|nr:type II toxin-antitoxin system RelE/ParE family toxin [Blastocatellia bacterium]
MKLFWTEPAIQDLSDLRDYIAADSDLHAAAFITSIVTRAERLTIFPMIGRVVPEAQAESIRELLFRSYRIIYRVVGERVDVLAVIHGSRDLWGEAPKPWELE